MLKKMVDIDFHIDNDLIKSLSNRKSILFDTNVWIDIAERKSAIAVEVGGKLDKLVSLERIFCPLCAATIWEVRKQTYPSLSLVTDVMERLSINVTFRSYQERCENEINYFINQILSGRYQSIPVDKIYGPVLSYLAAGVKLKFPLGWKQEDATHFADHISGILNRMSFEELLKLIDAKPPKESKLPADYASVNKKRHSFCKGNIQKIHRVEQECVAGKTVIPLINKQRSKLPLDMQIRFTQQIQALPRSKKYDSAIEYILNYLPSIHANVEVMIITGLDTNRKNRVQDFYDREILIDALSYPDIFVSQDRWINSIMGRNPQKQSNPKLKYFFDLFGLNIELSKLLK